MDVVSCHRSDTETPCNKGHLIGLFYQREKIEYGYQKMFEKRLLGTNIWLPVAGGILTGKCNCWKT